VFIKFQPETVHSLLVAIALSQLEAPGLSVMVIVGDAIPVPKPENMSLRPDVESLQPE
jgi:hypothetical protein